MEPSKVSAEEAANLAALGYLGTVRSTPDEALADPKNQIPKRVAAGEFPNWSPDGKSLVYTKREGDAYQVWTIEVNGASPKRLTKDARGGHYPSWSPDGRRIVFSRLDGNELDLWVMDSDGTGLKRLTSTTELSERKASWSPDGKLIAFEATPQDAPDGWQASIYVIDVEGGPPRQITPSRFNDTRPPWLRVP